MIEKDGLKFHCLGCGDLLGEKDQEALCAKCLLNLEFDVGEIDFDHMKDHLIKILDHFSSDVRSAFEKDPAARSIVEVLTSYPGIKAIILHRVAHFFYEVGLPFVPRFLSDVSRQITGIDIHPGAEIGSNFFIDHGSGTVIGETAEVGDNCTLYQNVTLGGTSLKREKRHPTLGNNVVIGAGAKLLGPIKIGNNVKVGANSVVVGVPGRIISREGKIIPRIDLEHADLPDPVVNLIKRLEDRIISLEQKNTEDDEELGGEFFDSGGGI